jgi:hypothetical protein
MPTPPKSSTSTPTHATPKVQSAAKESADTTSKSKAATATRERAKRTGATSDK